jgi:hypothetical protein
MNTDKHGKRILAAALLAAAAAGTIHAAAQAPAGPRIDVTFAAAAHGQAITGMVYFAISADNRTPPIQQTDPDGVPLFSKYVEQLQPGATVSFDSGYRGHPLAAPRDIPAGEYWIQPFVNVYTRFPRADGHTVQGGRADHPAARHRDGQADQDPEPDPDPMVGPADLPRRDDSPAQGLRHAPRRVLSDQLHRGPFLARRS